VLEYWSNVLIKATSKNSKNRTVIANEAKQSSVFRHNNKDCFVVSLLAMINKMIFRGYLKKYMQIQYSNTPTLQYSILPQV